MRGDAGLPDLLERSLELTREGRHDEHLELMRAAVGRYPSDLEVVIRAAGAHLEAEPARAEHLAERAVEMAPKDPTTLTRAAYLMFALERFDRSLELTRTATKHAEEEFALAFELVHLGGKLAAVRGEIEQAESLLRIAFENEPEAARHGEVLAKLLDGENRHREALTVVEEAVRYRPDDRGLEELRIRLRVILSGLDGLPPGYTVTQE